jgi:hypothetical protein
VTKTLIISHHGKQNNKKEKIGNKEKRIAQEKRKLVIKIDPKYNNS